MRVLSAAEQVAAFLRSKIQENYWGNVMPGGNILTRQLGVGRTTVDVALSLLEDEGLLVSKGIGKRRKIVASNRDAPARSLRIGIFHYEAASLLVHVPSEIRHALTIRGHTVVLPPKALTELKMDAQKVAQVVEQIDVDAWLIEGASEEILRWFMNYPKPSIAYAGQYPDNMTLASIAPSRQEAFRVLAQKLVELGHRKIVYISRSKSHPTSFFKGLKEHGISIGPYNLQILGPKPDDLKSCILSLFATTPPTALLIDEADVFIAIQLLLTRMGIFAPEHVSLICTDHDTLFAHCHPSVAHLAWESGPVVRRILKWAENISRNKEDKRQVCVTASFVDGGTLGPVPIEMTHKRLASV